MSSLDREIRNVQNAAFGSAMLAAFVQGYYDADETKRGTPFPYVFLVLPIVLHSEIYRLLATTQASLRHMAEKFVATESAGTDLLLSINRRALQLRELTAESLAVAFAAGLLQMDSQTGRLVPRKVEEFSSRPEIPDEAEQSRKLGRWLALLSPFEIGSILKVTF